MQRIEIKTTQNVTIEYELASLRDRILAFVIDITIVGIAYLILSVFFTTAFSVFLDGSMLGVIMALLPVVGFIGYQFFSELFSDGQSLGKRALNIKVVRLDGRQPSLTDFLLRAVFHIIDTIFSSGILAALVVSTSVKRQRLGDMTANTTVIRTNNHLNFRLEDILNIESLEKYTPKYPEVKKMSDEDMLVIKNVIRRYQMYDNPAHAKIVNQLIGRLSILLDIQTPNGNKIEFLRTLLKDYIVLTR
jgi:uncharacterized RDD family membrane protein YckC